MSLGRTSKKEPGPKLSMAAAMARDEQEAQRTIACPTCGAAPGERCDAEGGGTWSGTIHTKRWRALEDARRERERLAVECPVCKAPEGSPCRSRDGHEHSVHKARVLAAKSKASKDASKPKKRPKRKPAAQAELGANGLSLDELSAPKLREALERRCTECGAFPGAPCTTIPRDEPGDREELRDASGARLVHAARRTLEMDLASEQSPERKNGKAGPPKTWADMGLPAGVAVPSLDDSRRERPPHPWVICPAEGVDTHMLPILYGTTAPPSLIGPAHPGDRGWIIGYAYEAVPGATLCVSTLYDCRLSGSTGIPAEQLDLGPALWLTSREDIADQLLRFGYDASGIATLLERTGWAKGSKKPRAKKAKPTPPPVTCLDCEHAACPIVPDCSGCPTCAAERAANGTDAKITRAEALLEEPAREQLTHEEAAAEGPGSSAAVATLERHTMDVQLTLLRRDGGTQPRAAIDPDVVEEYAQAYRAGVDLPPLVAFFDGTDYWLADGFQRTAALELEGRPLATVDVRPGTQRDAILYSCGANAQHGVRRSRADKRRAVFTLLDDPEWSRKSDRWIAEQCKVHPSTVGDLRKRAQVSGSDTSEPVMREGRDGKLYPSRAAAAEPSSSPASATPPPIEPDEDDRPCELCLGLGADDEEGCMACGQVALEPLFGEGAAGPLRVAEDLADASSLEPRPPPAKRKWRDVLELPAGPVDPLLVIEHHVRLSSVIGLTDEERAELDRARAFGLSQWQTMPDLADRMVELAGLAGLDRPSVLEPSAGAGALVRAVRRACGLDAHITAHEIDPVYARDLKNAPRVDGPDVVHEGDFFAWESPTRPYDACVMNPAYEGGADGAFLARAMDSSLRVVALLRLNALTGARRRKQVWSRVESGEWHLLDQAILEHRPEFIGPGDDSAKSDYVVIHLARASIAQRSLTRAVWW